MLLLRAAWNLSSWTRPMAISFAGLPQPKPLRTESQQSNGYTPEFRL